MAWGILVLFGLVVLGAVLWVTVVGWPWENPPIPPPQPTPFILSAVGTSARTVHLTVHRGTGAWSQIEIERFQTEPPATYRFVTSSDELDDKDLLPNTLYRYRARFTHGPSPWSDPEEQGKEAITLTEAFNHGQLYVENNGWQGYCLVQRIEAGVLSTSGERVSLTLRASAQGASIDRIYISQADTAPGMDPYDSVEYRAAMHDILFKPPLAVEPLQAITLAAIEYTLDRTKPLLIAVDFSATPASGVMFREVSTEVANAFYKLQAPLGAGDEPEARKMDRQGYDPAPGGIFLIERIDVG